MTSDEATAIPVTHRKTTILVLHIRIIAIAYYLLNSRQVFSPTDPDPDPGFFANDLEE